MSDSDNSDISDIDQAPVVKTRRKQAADDVIQVNGANADGQLSGRRRKLTIHRSDADDGDRAVFVGINGYGYHIPRGKTVEVPDEVIEALNNAVVTRYSSGKDGKVVAMDAPRYAFTVL